MTAPPAPVRALKDITKRFGPVVANRAVSWTIAVMILVNLPWARAALRGAGRPG